MKIDELFTTALHINDPWFIESMTVDHEKKRLDIHINFKRGATFSHTDENTGETTEHKAYDTREKTWRHLNFFEYQSYLVVRTPRIKTKNGIFLVLPPWSGVVYGFTLMFEAFILQMCRYMPVCNVGQMFQIYDKKLWHLLDCYVIKSQQEDDLSRVKILGMDETSLKKGHEYITLFVDLIQKRTIHIADGKGSQTITDFVQAFEDSKGVKENISDVSCDMSPAFIKGVQEKLPNAAITFDKFHILKIINESVDAVRRAEVKTVPALRGARFAVLKNKENLTIKQAEKREYLSQLNLKTSRAVRIREAFQAIYQATDIHHFEQLLKEWYHWATHSKLDAIKKVAKTIKNHWAGILRWKESQINNGILEGLNSIIQAAKRMARGYGRQHLKTMAFLLTGKLNLQRFNPYLPTDFS